MKTKSFLFTMGLGMVAGAATMLMIPRHSEAYRMADDAVQTLKQEAGKMLDSIHLN